MPTHMSIKLSDQGTDSRYGVCDIFYETPKKSEAANTWKQLSGGIIWSACNDRLFRSS